MCVAPQAGAAEVGVLVGVDVGVAVAVVVGMVNTAAAGRLEEAAVDGSFEEKTSCKGMSQVVDTTSFY